MLGTSCKCFMLIYNILYNIIEIFSSYGDVPKDDQITLKPLTSLCIGCIDALVGQQF